MTRPLQAITLAAALLLAASASAATLKVCATAGAGCQYVGSGGLQAAVDASIDGDKVRVKAGSYTPEKFRDVPYKQYVIRGALAIEGKRIDLLGEPGAILDGKSGPAVSAIVVRGGDVVIRDLTVRNFRAGEKEDDLYEGHGIFVLDARVHLDDVTIERYEKMGLTGRGSSLLTATKMRIADGHVAVWLEESAHLRLCNSVVSNNDSAGIAAYVNASANVYNSVFDRNQDDGLYAAGLASIVATNTLLLRNKPFAIRATDDARIVVMHSVLFGNEANSSTPKGKQLVKLGAGISKADPKANDAYELPSVLDGDPDVIAADGSKSRIGLLNTAVCANSR